MSMRESVPWWVRIAAKLVLARLPVPYAAWQRLGVFRHGAMDDADYALEVLRGHLASSKVGSLVGRTVLELGPGDSAATAVIVAAMGGRAILVDAGPFAPTDAAPYRRLAARLASEGLTPPDLTSAATLGDVLEACAAEYRTDGLLSLRELADGTVDLVFSQAVLEHVRRSELRDTLQELNRLLVPSGVSSHIVDLRDHLGGGLANLRFPARIWESELFSSAGFYTNRVALSEFEEMLAATHQDVIIHTSSEWDRPPIRRSALSREFRDRAERDLMTRSFGVVMRHRAVSL